ncbi:hypothetical protein [Microbacterium murale]|uniref:Uncharacterized protein n=1 Tax=Microbacterium murale TaxID=1081040 RepID=A0ABQ1RWR9_9MICO|nr:hypothetical protein [Microbacterium murale]GGD83142.1 hypothetical protein GCM10007269_27480 [Microbacterium murale]
MSIQLPADPVASGPDLSRLWYADPTGQAAVHNIMVASRPDDYALVDVRGNVLFRIKPHVLADVLPMLNFTHTRRGRGTIRAHKKNALAGAGTPSQGE